MAIPLALMAAGAALQVYGQYQANMAQAQQEFANAKFYEDQASFAREAQFRQSYIAARQYDQMQGAQVSAYARGGVDISGSAAVSVADTLANKTIELNAIKRKGELEYRLAISRSRQAQGMGVQLSSFEHNLLQGGGTVLGLAAKASDNNPDSKFSKWLTSTFGD